MATSNSPIDQMIRQTMIDIVDPALVSEVIAREWDKFVERTLPEEARRSISSAYSRAEYLDSKISDFISNRSAEVDKAIDSAWSQFLSGNGATVIMSALQEALKKEISRLVSSWMSDQGEEHIKAGLERMLNAAASNVFSGTIKAMVDRAISDMGSIDLRVCGCGRVSVYGQMCSSCGAYVA